MDRPRPVPLPSDPSQDALRGAAEIAIRDLLAFIGEDPTRDGLLDTPSRVARALWEMTRGTQVDVGELLSRRFQHNGYDGMVVVTGVEFVSLCEHHLLPFTGTATVGYIPSTDHVVGLSKLARVVDAFAHRLQLQEQMTNQIADALVAHLDPIGVGVIVRATHACMSCRGVRKPGAEMVTSSLRGAMFDKPEARAEFMAFV